MKININNTEKLQSELDVVQKRSQCRMITIDDINDIIAEIDERFNALNIAKKYRKSARFDVDIFASIFPSSYKYIPESTQFSLEMGASGWFVTGLYRYGCNHGAINRINFVNEAEFKRHYRF